MACTPCSTSSSGASALPSTPTTGRRGPSRAPRGGSDGPCAPEPLPTGTPQRRPMRPLDSPSGMHAPAPLVQLSIDTVDAIAVVHAWGRAFNDRDLDSLLE